MKDTIGAPDGSKGKTVGLPMLGSTEGRTNAGESDGLADGQRLGCCDGDMLSFIRDGSTVGPLDGTMSFTVGATETDGATEGSTLSVTEVASDGTNVGVNESS